MHLEIPDIIRIVKINHKNLPKQPNTTKCSRNKKPSVYTNFAIFSRLRLSIA